MSSDNADPATSNNESTVDITADMTAANIKVPTSGGNISFATNGIAKSPLGSKGNKAIAARPSIKTNRLMPVTKMIVSKTPRRIAFMSFIAYRRMSFSGVAIPPRKKAIAIVISKAVGIPPH